MIVTNNKKRLTGAFILLLCVLGVIFGIPDLWHRGVNVGYEMVFTESTCGLVVADGDIIEQSFVAEDDYLKSISVLMVSGENGNGSMPGIVLTDQNGRKLVNRQLEFDPGSGMMKVDVSKKLHQGNRYTMTITIENTQNVFSTYFVPISDLAGNYGNGLLNGEESDGALFTWFSYGAFAADLIFPFLISFILIEIMILFSFSNRTIEIIWHMAGVICSIVLCINAVNRLSEKIAGSTYESMWGGMYGRAWGVTILLLLAFSGIFIMTTKRLGLGIMISVTICFVYGMVSHYVMAFRGTPFLPIDIFAWKTAGQVALNYNYRIDDTILLSAVSYLTIFVCCNCIKNKIPLGILKRIIGTAISGTVCFIMCTPQFSQMIDLQPHYYLQEYGNQKYGAIFNFVTNIRSCFHVKPKGYSGDSVKEIMSEGNFVSDIPNQAEEYPDIIVVMNESWADIDISNGLGLRESVMPEIDSISKEENAFMGNTVVSTYGGNTNTSEFAFLTGSVMSFGLTGSCYDLDCKEGVMSLVSILKELGYYTIALHPENPENWDRDIGYEKLGFDRFLSIEDLAEYDFEYLRSYNYVSDSSLYKVIYDLTDKEEFNNKPVFIFCITMQNHGNYNDDSYVASVDIDDMQIAQYLSLIKETDRAFKELVDHYRSGTDKAVILMFGDHLPALDNIDSLVERRSLERYTTPYIFWSNAPLNKPENIPCYSVNYLQTVLFDVSGLPLTGYQKFLKNAAEKYPIISMGKYYDADMNYELFLTGNIPKVIMDYEILQYNNLFGEEKERVDAFFSYVD